MADAGPTILLIGYGNPGRGDDGLGPALAEAVAALAIDGVTVDANYQLQVEDAKAIAEHRVVVFADADVSCGEPFRFEPVAPASEVTFTTHSIGPGSVLAMAHDMFGATTKGYVLGIRGYEFNRFGERLTERAAANLAAAIEFIGPVLRDRRFDAYNPNAGAAPSRAGSL